ncbi:crooked neck protein [Perilla frutescens var. hirtella]|uniref:Crooked neck protein n=1 Tax=Perilla frutescens var. hirtella TaxID=608512 RepID=A0AAD4P0F7_PERFH|nr:crooked neck protein [Perilla frutescens var. hirtella]
MSKKTNPSVSVSEKLGRTEKSLEKLDKIISKMEEKVQNSTRDKLLLEEKVESLERKLSEELRVKKASEEVYETRLRDLEQRILKLETRVFTNSPTIQDHDDYQDTKSINQLRFQGQLMLHLLLHLDMGASKERLVFKINNSNTVFGPNEFSLITGLCFGTSEATTTAASSSNFHNYVFQVSRGKIDMQYLHLVEDLHKFNEFPWGLVAYQLLVSSTLSVRSRMDVSKLTHPRAPIDMYGFSYALQAWVYEVMPFVATHCAFRSSNIENLSPRILRWFATKIFRFNDLKQFFTPSGNAHLVLSGIQDSPKQKNTMVKREELSTDTIRAHIKEKCDDVGVIKRRRPGFEDRLESLPRKFDQPIVDISSDDDEAVKKAEQPASATTPTGHTKPQLLWKECSDFEISESDYEKSKAFYERLLNRTKRLKLWINYAQFEAFAMKQVVHESGLPDKRECLHRARAVFERALSYFRTSAPELKEERAMLLEEWFHMENSFGELGDVDLVRAKLPRKLEKRRLIEAEDAPTRYEEYVEYIFPDETPRAKDVQILEAAYKWKNDTKKTMKVYDRRARNQPRGSWPDLPCTL